MEGVSFVKEKANREEHFGGRASSWRGPSATGVPAKQTASICGNLALFRGPRAFTGARGHPRVAALRHNWRRANPPYSAGSIFSTSMQGPPMAEASGGFFGFDGWTRR